MKKLLLSLLTLTASLSASPQAVVFDWGNVLAFEDRSVVVDFLCETFKLSKTDFEKINLEKRKAVLSGKSDVDFWIDFGKNRGIKLSTDWKETYNLVVKKSVGVDSEMYAMIDELKNNNIQVGLLSNINNHYIKLIRSFGFYEPFDPCILSGEIEVEKPDRRAYEILLEKMNLPAEDVVFIDDRIENVDAAKEMGIDAIVFESSDQIRQELVKRGLFMESYKKEDKEKKYIIGISVRTSNEHFQKEALPLWDKFFKENLSEKIPNLLNKNLFVVYTDYEGDYTKPFTYVIGYEVSNLKKIPKGMIGVEIPSSSYAVFTAKGNYPQSLINSWQTIWKSEETLNRLYTTDFEFYGSDFDPQNSSEVKIYIASDLK